MRANLKKELVDRLNQEFESLLAKKERPKYARHLRTITKKIVETRPQNRREMQRIITSQRLDLKTSTKMFVVLANATSLIMATPTTPQQKEKLAPLQQIMRAYNVMEPKRFAENVYNMTTGKNMTARNKRFRQTLLSYYDGFTENIETAEQQSNRALVRTQLEARNQMFKDLEDLREARVPVARQKTILLEKYNNPVRIQRALNTELHEQAERTKLEVSKYMKYTHKEWNTQRDEKVRRTKFHNSIDRKRVPIDSQFRAGGLTADHPGDINLPAGERINCRCYITYFNGPGDKIRPTTVPTPPKP